MRKQLSDFRTPLILITEIIVCLALGDYIPTYLKSALYAISLNGELRHIVEARSEDQWELWDVLNILYVGRNDVFTVSNELLRIRGLETYTLGTATSDTIDVQDRFLTIVEYGSIARYWRWRYKSVVEVVSKMSIESSRTPLQELIMLSDRFDRLYEIEKAKLKPQKPPRTIPRYLQGGGRP